MTNELSRSDREAIAGKVLEFGERVLRLNDHQAIVDLFISQVSEFGYAGIASGRLTYIDQRRFPTFYLLNWPDHFVTTYVAGGYINYDPIVEFAISSVDTFLWSDCIAAAAARGMHNKTAELFSCAAEIGWHEGLAIPLHRRNGHELISVAGDKIDLRDATRAAVTLMAHVAHERAVALTHRVRDTNDGLGLRPEDLAETELDCLKWMCAGATDAEIAERLKLSDSEIQAVFGRLIKRLNVESREQLLLTVVYSSVLLV